MLRPSCDLFMYFRKYIITQCDLTLYFSFPRARPLALSLSATVTATPRRPHHASGQSWPSSTGSWRPLPCGMPCPPAGIPGRFRRRRSDRRVSGSTSGRGDAGSAQTSAKPELGCLGGYVLGAQRESNLHRTCFAARDDMLLCAAAPLPVARKPSGRGEQRWLAGVTWGAAAALGGPPHLLLRRKLVMRGTDGGHHAGGVGVSGGQGLLVYLPERVGFGLHVPPGRLHGVGLQRPRPRAPAAPPTQPNSKHRQPPTAACAVCGAGRSCAQDRARTHQRCRRVLRGMRAAQREPAKPLLSALTTLCRRARAASTSKAARAAASAAAARGVSSCLAAAIATRAAS